MKTKKQIITDAELIADIKMIKREYMKKKYSKEEAKQYLMNEIGNYLKGI